MSLLCLILLCRAAVLSPNQLDDPIGPGAHDAVVRGCFILINLPQGRYRIDFGGHGTNNYFTRSIYDIYITGDQRDLLKDNSLSISSSSIINNSIFTKSNLQRLSIGAGARRAAAEQTSSGKRSKCGITRALTEFSL